MSIIAKLTLFNSDGVTHKVIDTTVDSLHELKKRIDRRIMIEKDVYVFKNIEEIKLSDYAQHVQQATNRPPVGEDLMELIDEFDKRKRSQTLLMNKEQRLAVVLEWIKLISTNAN